MTSKASLQKPSLYTHTSGIIPGQAHHVWDINCTETVQMAAPGIGQRGACQTTMLHTLCSQAPLCALPQPPQPALTLVNHADPARAKTEMDNGHGQGAQTCPHPGP